MISFTDAASNDKLAMETIERACVCACMCVCVCVCVCVCTYVHAEAYGTKDGHVSSRSVPSNGRLKVTSTRS